VETGLNSGERILSQLCCGISEQNTKKVLDGIGFLVRFAAGSFNGETNNFTTLVISPLIRSYLKASCTQILPLKKRIYYEL